MKILRYSLPTSKEYDSPIFEAVTLQIVLGLLSLLVWMAAQLREFAA